MPGNSTDNFVAIILNLAGPQFFGSVSTQTPSNSFYSTTSTVSLLVANALSSNSTGNTIETITNNSGSGTFRCASVGLDTLLSGLSEGTHIMGGCLAITYMGPLTGSLGFVESASALSIKDSYATQLNADELAIVRHFFSGVNDTAFIPIMPSRP